MREVITSLKPLVNIFSDGRHVRVIDLSVTLSEQFPCTWPGHMPFAHKNSSWFTEVDLPTGERCRSLGPYQTNFLLIDEHCGTHLDGPSHFIPPEASGLPWAGPMGRITGDKLDLAQLIGPAAVVDLRSLGGHDTPGFSPAITRSHLQAWEEHHGNFQAGDVVLLWTEWSRYYAAGPRGRRYVQGPMVTRSSPGWPALDPEAAIFLCERGVVTVGTDAPSMGAVQDGAPVHWEGLSRGMLFIELLTNLGRLPSRGAVFVFLPLKIAASSGGPGRAIVLIDQANSLPSDPAEP
jgi:kynurenine formamidase